MTVATASMPPLEIPHSKMIVKDRIPLESAIDGDCNVDYKMMESVDCQTDDANFVSIHPAKFFIPICSIKPAKRMRRVVGNGKIVQLTCLPRKLRFVSALTWSEDKMWRNVSCAIPYDCSSRFLYEPSILKSHTKNLRKLLQANRKQENR
ncbi:hypothetical protein ACOME3_009366 [Neoechinorhynchus agilis]